MANIHHNRTSILIVDDHEVVRNGIRSYLETVKEFHVVGEAASGEEAVKLVSEYIPDIVLLDLEMPKHDGYEVIVTLRKYLDASVPIVACTVHTAEINRTRKLGFSGFIAKPLDMDRFSEQVRRILNGEPIWEAR